MKKVISGNELYDNMTKAINLICSTVKTTLGPKGCNVIIDESNLSPYITNDGVTIANNICSDDEVINAILTITKEASIKTNNDVGDGTTSTLVLLEKIFNEGLKEIKCGKNPMILKKELHEDLEDIILEINKYNKKPSNDDLLKIATISGGNNKIGENVTKSYLKSNEIEIIEDTETYIEEINGYTFDTIIASPYFFTYNKELSYNNSCIILFHNDICSTEEIANILNYTINNDRSLILVANDYSENFINETINLYLDSDIKICLLKNPEYGIRRYQLYEDLKAITKANITNDIITINDIGTINTIKINNENTNIMFTYDNDIKNRIKEITKSGFDEYYISQKLAMFTSSLIKIHISANTDTERKEMKMRYDDALCAIREAKNGIIPGSGLILYQISDKCKNKIFKNSLSAILDQILYNAGLDENKIKDYIKSNNFQKIYNIINDMYESVDDTSVLDPTSVVINSLVNATSIASMLLTTTSIIVNEHIETHYTNEI